MRYRKRRISGTAVGIALLLIFCVWTYLIQHVDVQLAGEYEPQKNVGFATINTWFHGLTGYSEKLYRVTDWLGLVPIAVCIGFGILGLVQMIRRKGMGKVDKDILLLGVYYILVIFAYLAFEMIPINYRPVLVDGLAKPETSYPSSTTLLVLSVMPTLIYQVNRRVSAPGARTTVNILTVLFTVFMVAGRTISGVHWMTDIIGSFFLGMGLFLIYRAAADRLRRQ